MPALEIYTVNPINKVREIWPSPWDQPYLHPKNKVGPGSPRVAQRKEERTRKEERRRKGRKTGRIQIQIEPLANLNF